MAALVGLMAIALAPAIPLPYVSGRLVGRARALWLLGALTVGIVWLAPRDLWLALIALWFLIQWPRHPDPPSLVPSAVQWAGVGVTWGLLLAIPRDGLAWAPWGWLAIAGWQSLTLVMRKYKRGGRQTGDFGSPVLTALYLALVSPFCPWWGWPLLGSGLVVVWSWHAFLAVGVGWVWGHPELWLLGTSAAATGALAVGLSRLARPWRHAPAFLADRPLLEWTPRGDTLDSLVSRWRGWVLLVRHGRAHWLLGAGPNTLEPALLRWGTRYDIELCWGEGFNDPLQLWYEYGLLGVLAMGAFVWRVWPGLTLGDSWSAAWIAGVVLALGHWPLRHISIGLPWFAVSAYLTGTP